MTAALEGLQITGLSLDRGARRVLHSVSLSAAPGRITALLGPNGAGKSSLVQVIGGLFKPAAGTFALDGAPLTGQRPERVRAAGLAIVPEGRWVLRSLTVEENLQVACYALPRKEVTDRLDYALALFPELQKRWKTPARALSGGEQQMVVIAQSLMSRPRIVAIDELSLGLAPVVVRRLAAALSQIARDGTGILLIEQFAHVALSISSDACILRGGRVRYSGTAAALEEDPELVRRAYLSATAAHDVPDPSTVIRSASTGPNGTAP